MEKKVSVEITPKSIVLIIVIVVGFLAALQVYQILLLFFFAFIISSALGPILDTMIRKKVPKSLSMLLIYTGIILFLSFLAVGIFVPIVIQLEKFIRNFPVIVTSIISFFATIFPGIENQLEVQNIILSIQKSISEGQYQNLLSNLTSASQSIGSLIVLMFTIAGNAITGLFYFVTILIVSGFLLLERGRDSKEKKIIKGLFGDNSIRLVEIFRKVETKLGAWVSGQFIMSSLTAIVSWVIFTILGFEFATLIALIGFVLAAIPTLGPSILTFVGALIALGSGASPVLVLVYMIVFAIYQQLENMFVYPYVMKKTVGLNPVFTLIGALIGFQLAGLAGALIVIPIIAIFQIVIEDYVERKNGKL